MLCAACFDSDYLYLNLINTLEEINAWIGIGRGADVGIKRRSALTPWRKKVVDYSAFAAAAKETYVCADEFLSVAAPHLELPMEQGATSLHYLKDEELNAQATYYYFRMEGEKNDTRVPKLTFMYSGNVDPCLDGRENQIAALNMGVASKGITIYFTGPYVEHEEITFSEVTVLDHQENRQWFDLQPEKEQLPDGQWAYVCRVPEYEIPPAVPDRMLKEKRAQLRWTRYIRLFFTPHGNPRKMLDVTVVMVPDENPQGQVVWNIWHPHGSKSEFIKHHNKMWKWVRKMEPEEKCLPLFKESDFD